MIEELAGSGGMGEVYRARLAHGEQISAEAERLLLA